MTEPAVGSVWARPFPAATVEVRDVSEHLLTVRLVGRDYRIGRARFLREYFPHNVIIGERP